LFDYGEGFLSSGGRGRGVKEKDKHAAGKKNNTNGPFGFWFSPLVNVTGTVHVQDGSLTEGIVVVSSPAMDEHVVAAGNTKDVNVGQTSIRPTVDPNLGASYAKLFTSESSRKSVNFCTIITPTGNGTDVAVPLKSIRAIGERFVNTAYVWHQSPHVVLN
ncbi:hypothetical protein Tco_1231818, partial [Tanacetum coccineum]